MSHYVFANIIYQKYSRNCYLIEGMFMTKQSNNEAHSICKPIETYTTHFTVVGIEDFCGDKDKTNTKS